MNLNKFPFYVSDWILDSKRCHTMQGFSEQETDDWTVQKREESKGEYQRPLEGNKTAVGKLPVLETTPCFDDTLRSWSPSRVLAGTRERRVWAAISNHTQDYTLVPTDTHFVGRQTIQRKWKAFGERVHRPSREFCFPLKTCNVPQCSRIPTEPPSHMRKHRRHEGCSAWKGKTREGPHRCLQISTGLACNRGSDVA